MYVCKCTVQEQQCMHNIDTKSTPRMFHLRNCKYYPKILLLCLNTFLQFLHGMLTLSSYVIKNLIKSTSTFINYLCFEQYIFYQLRCFCVKVLLLHALLVTHEKPSQLLCINLNLYLRKENCAVRLCDWCKSMKSFPP